MIDNRAIAKIAAINRFRELEDSGSSYPDALSGALALAQVIAQGIDTEALRAEIEADLSVVAHEARVLVDPTGHTPWLTPERKDATAWKFWDRYRNYLAIERGFPTKVINRLDVDTDALLGYLEDPTIADRDFDTRGLVMGNVQSGKTTNYSALINKAIDAGYKLIVVLAGLHNNLRSQTQMRLDAEVLGFDTAVTMVGQNVAVPLGVMKIPGAVYLPVHSLTSRKERGDFSTNVAQQAMVQPGGDPILLVIKKNETVLRNLVRYYRDLCPASVHDPKAGRRIIRNVPVLVID
ncbi:MAG: endonuclease, partial [Actinobacteria bacterium]|nr:endonuclease [Actinomycetota bacterium]